MCVCVCVSLCVTVCGVCMLVHVSVHVCVCVCGDRGERHLVGEGLLSGLAGIGEVRCCFNVPWLVYLCICYYE